MIYVMGSRECRVLQAFPVYGYQHSHRAGGDQMVPSMTIVLQRFTGEWAGAAATQSDPHRMRRNRVIPPGMTACSRRSPPCRDSCDRFCMATAPAVICPICRACASAQPHSVKPEPDARGTSLTSSSIESESRAALSVERKADGRPSHVLGRWRGMLHARYPCLTGRLRPTDGSHLDAAFPGAATGAVPCRHGTPPEAGGRPSPLTISLRCRRPIRPYNQGMYS